MQLDGKCGVIFGVANDHSIAWHVGRAAHEAGARLAFNYQNERVEAGARELVATLEGALCLPCDLMRDDQLDHFFEHVREAFGGRLDFLVHSLAFARREDLAGRYVDTPRPNFTLALEVSVYSLVAAARRAAPLMQASGGGAIVTLSYLGAERVIKNYNVMGVAKAALEASVRYLAADLGEGGIRVNAISAGPVRTLAASGITGFSRVLRQVADHAPLRRNIDPGEIAHAAVFLVSDAARAITGEVIHVDAGYNIMGL